MTILCATDFSDGARGAAAVAAAIAHRGGEALLLLHSAPFSTEAHQRLHAALEAEASRLRTGSLAVNTELRFGWPDNDVIDVAEEADASMIVVGAVGLRLRGQGITGSLPERLAERTRRPLLVVRHPEALEAWAAGASTLTCMVGTDLRPSSRRIMEATNRLTALGRTKVVLTYVVYHPAEYARMELSGPIYRRRLHPVVEEVVVRGLDEQARTITGAESVETRHPMTLGRLSGPLSAPDPDPAELIVVGAHQRRGLRRLWYGSVAHDVLHLAPANVLVIPLHGALEDEARCRPPEITAALAATDFSAGGDRALAWLRAVTPADARLMLLTVVEEEGERAAGMEALRTRAELLGLGAATCEVAVAHDVAAAIAAAAERFGARLVCVGASGDGGTAHPFFGSVARALLTRSRVPVLAVRET